jgi:hypothetical protein
MFLFSGRVTGKIELNQFLVTQQIKSCSIQPRALSITQGRAVGVAHYLLGGIATTWAFFLARSRLIQQYLPLKFPHILWGKQSWGYGHTVVYSGYMGPAIPSSAEFTSARRSCEEYNIVYGGTSPGYRAHTLYASKQQVKGMVSTILMSVSVLFFKWLSLACL